MVGPSDPALEVPDRIWETALSFTDDSDASIDDDLVPDDQLDERDNTDTHDHGEPDWAHHDGVGDSHHNGLSDADAAAFDSHDDYAPLDDTFDDE